MRALEPTRPCPTPHSSQRAQHAVLPRLSMPDIGPGAEAHFAGEIGPLVSSHARRGLEKRKRCAPMQESVRLKQSGNDIHLELDPVPRGRDFTYAQGIFEQHEDLPPLYRHSSQNATADAAATFRLST